MSYDMRMFFGKGSQVDRACPACRRSFGLFRWRKRCAKCNVRRCADCLTELPALEWISKQLWPVEETWCQTCVEALEPDYKRYDAALQKAKQVEAWPRTYKGNVPRDQTAPTIKVSSKWFREKSDAEFQVKFEAAFHGFDLLFDLWFDKDSDSEPSESGKGTYHYTIWRAHAQGARKK
jgi:hypothetical protein